MSQSGALAGKSAILPSNVPTSFITDNGTAVPTNYQLNVNGHIVAAGSTPVHTAAPGSTNIVTINTQISQAIASTDATKVGLAAFDSSAFHVDGNGFVTLMGSSSPFSRFVVQSGTSPVIPSGGTIAFNGSAVAAGTNPVITNGTGANTVELDVQITQAIASTDVTKVGLATFNSAQFSVDANGFVSVNSSGPALTITGNDGVPLSTSSNNWNIIGFSGSKTSGAGSTLTIESPPFFQVSSSASSSLNTGEFVNAAVTRDLPASLGLGNGELFIYICTTSNALVIQASGTQKIRIGANISSAAGTATSNAIGDSLTLRFNASDDFFYAVSVIGIWTLA